MMTAIESGDPRAPWVWLFATKILDDNDNIRLRCNRAFAQCHFFILDDGTFDTQIFFVSDQHVLTGVRKKSLTWGATKPLAGSRLLHPFSDIAATLRAPDAVNVFYLDDRGCLCVSVLPVSEKDWPGDNHLPLQKVPTLKLEGPLVAVSPSYRQVLVFGISRDLKLHMAVYNHDDTKGTGTWSDLAEVKGLQDNDSRLFMHASLDAYVADESTIYVASITEINEPCVYFLTREGDSWIMHGASDRHYYPNKPL
jgi:hypothetical protein